MYGIPNLLSGVSVKSVVTGILGAIEGALWGLLAGDSGWDIYKPGTSTSAVEFDSIVSVDQIFETNVSEYIIESGGFVSYNKVRKPRILKIRITKGGSKDDREKFMTWLDRSVQTASLFDICMPEGAYPNYTLETYSTSRSSESGATVIIADCVFKNVRLIPQTYVNSATGATTTTQTTTNASAPSAKPPSVLQRVAAQVPGGSAALKIASKIGWL